MNFQNRTAINQQNQKPSETMLYLVPQHVSITENFADEPPIQIIGRQEKFIRLEKKIRYKLASYDTGQKIQAIGQKYQFELLRLANITRLIREYYFGEIRLENFPTEIEKRMGVSLLTAQEITRYIKSEIIDWDPWAEYLAKLPKMPIREIAQKHPKIANMEITKGYIELKGSDDLEDPSIKNWLKDYISHLGYDRHSQMDRTQYIFHSENGKDLDSQDREKLGIILKSFDENIPLPVDIENNEIIFDNEQRSKINSPTTVIKDQGSMTNIPRPLNIANAHQAPTKQESFIKPYSPIQQPQRPTLLPRPQPMREFVHPNLATQPNRQVNSPSHIAPQSEAGKEIDKYFNTPEIPEIKIHSITQHNEPKMTQQVAPRPTIQRPVQTLPPRQTSSPQPTAIHPKHRMIEPFSNKPMPEPRLDGNIVDLSANNDQ